jgi:hypothetical protein
MMSHFFVNYPQWAAQFKQSHWTQTYYVQRLREFLFELLVIHLWSCVEYEPFPKILTMKLAQDALESFYYMLATDQEEMVAEHLKHILFWLGESEFWQSELRKKVHEEQLSHVVMNAAQRKRNYCVHLSTWLLHEGFDASHLASDLAGETLASEQFWNTDIDHVYAYYSPPSLIWKQHMLHPWLVAKDSPFTYPHHSTD